MVKQFTTCFLVVFFAFQLQGQTCCSGGVPISTNLGFQSQTEGILQLALSYENNYLNSLYAESEKLGSNNRQRITESILFRSAYSFSERLSLETMVPFVTQKRNITTNSGEINREKSNGVGDIVLLAKYDVLKNAKWNINLGVGPKFPTGSTGQLNKLGLLLVNDLQPGSGSLDVISRISILHNLSFRPSLSLFLNGIYNLRGTDNDYLGSQSYRFGIDRQLMLGLSDQWIVSDRGIYTTMSVRYRNASRDEINKNTLENTGGKWLFLRGSLGIAFIKNTRISASYEFPVYTKVDGTQLSPDRIINISLFGSLDIKSRNSRINIKL